MKPTSTGQSSGRARRPKSHACSSTTLVVLDLVRLPVEAIFRTTPTHQATGATLERRYNVPRRNKFATLPPAWRDSADELETILVKGLPVTYKTAGPELLRLVGFEGDLADAAEADVWPYVDRLDTLIRQNLDCFENDIFRQAAHIYFGYAEGSRGIEQVGVRERKIAILYDCSTKKVQRLRDKTIIPCLIRQVYRVQSEGTPHP
jgi:hypothetical protein